MRAKWSNCHYIMIYLWVESHAYIYVAGYKWVFHTLVRAAPSDPGLRHRAVRQKWFLTRRRANVSPCIYIKYICYITKLKIWYFWERISEWLKRCNQWGCMYIQRSIDNLMRVYKVLSPKHVFQLHFSTFITWLLRGEVLSEDAYKALGDKVWIIFFKNSEFSSPVWCRISAAIFRGYNIVKPWKFIFAPNFLSIYGPIGYLIYYTKAGW